MRGFNYIFYAFNGTLCVTNYCFGQFWFSLTHALFSAYFAGVSGVFKKEKKA